METYTVNYDSPAFEKELITVYRKYGMAIISNVFSKEYCDDKMDDLISSFESLGTGIDRKRIKETWTRDNLPPQSRPGLYQTLVGHTNSGWDIRSHKHVRHIFKTLYSDLRGKEIDDYIVSFDGINVLPNDTGPYDKGKDWAHVDQTYGDIYKCIQGQAVLTNTTAAFRATPGSCHLFSDILEIAEVDEKDKSNWKLFKNNTITKVKAYCEEKGLMWQIPIYSKAGSFIVWSSSTIHSAKVQDKQEEKDKDDIWKGWRGVIYVCYRPREEVRKYVLEKRVKHFQNNRLTTHWGEKLFSKSPGGRYLYMTKREDIIEECLKNPKKIYEIIGKPSVNNLI